MQRMTQGKQKSKPSGLYDSGPAAQASSGGYIRLSFFICWSFTFCETTKTHDKSTPTDIGLTMPALQDHCHTILRSQLQLIGLMTQCHMGQKYI